MLIPILSVIVMATVVGYAAFFLLQRKYYREISKYQAQVSSFIASSLSDELTNLQETHLSGQTRQLFDETKQSYLYLINHRLPEISERLIDLQEACRQNRLLQVHRELQLIAAKLKAASELESKTQAEISSLKKSNQLHQQKLHDLEQKYQDLRKTLLAKNFSYGPSIDRLEENLSELEKTFDHYATFAQAGDYIKADQILNQLEKNTAVLDEYLKQIPPLYRSLKNVYPDQIAEISAGFKQLTAQKYGFPADFATLLKQTQAAIAENIVDLKELEIKAAQERDQQISQQIDQLYDRLEQEIKAQREVLQNKTQLNQFIHHARHQERELLLELDRLGQNYTFNHHEAEDGKELDEELKKIESAFTAAQKQITTGAPIYSEILQQQQQQVTKLQKIEEKQTKINQSIQGLWHEEKEARKAAQSFDLQLHQLYRKLVKQNLPGLPKDYLEFFKTVSQEVDGLISGLDQSKIDLDQINKQLLDIQADLDKLTEKTDDIADSAALAETLLQYANRYKTRYPQVAQAANQASHLFQQKYDYAASLEKIATAVDQVEPGAYKRLEDDYYATNPAKN